MSDYNNIIHAMEMYNMTSELLDDIAMGMLLPDGIDETQLIRVKSKAENYVYCSMERRANDKRRSLE